MVKRLKIAMQIINFVHHRLESAVKRVEFVSYGLSYIVLRSRWCNIIVLNVHAPSDEKGDDSTDSFYEELEQILDHFPKYYMKILLGDLNEKFSNQQLGMTVYIRIFMTMVLEL
jgi:hypothetical protein